MVARLHEKYLPLYQQQSFHTAIMSDPNSSATAIAIYLEFCPFVTEIGADFNYNSKLPVTEFLKFQKQ